MHTKVANKLNICFIINHNSVDMELLKLKLCDLPSIRPHVTFRLSNIFKCSVRLTRLTVDEIAQFTTNHGHRIIRSRSSVPADQHDHNYSFASIEKVADAKATEAVVITRTSTTLHDVVSKADNSAVSSPASSFCSSKLSGESDDNSDESTDYGTCNAYYVSNGAAYPINLNEIDEHKQEDAVEETNGFDCVAEHTNGFGYIITNGKRTPEIDVEYSDSHLLQSNGMDLRRTVKLSSEMNDEDEDSLLMLGLQQMLEQSADTNGLSANCDEDGNIWPSNRIFDDVCLKFLLDNCYNTYCEYRHSLPSPDMVAGRLQSASRRDIDEVQNHILLRYDLLASEFFTVFCTHYGREWQDYRENLRLLISVMSKRPSELATIYMKDILNGFLISGMKYSTCVNQLLLEIDDSLNMQEKFNILWELIIDSRNEKVAEHLRTFDTVLQSDALVNVKVINKILEHQLGDRLVELRDYAVNLVKKCHITTFRQIDSGLLKKYITYVRPFNLSASRAIQQKAVQFGLVFDK